MKEKILDLEIYRFFLLLVIINKQIIDKITFLLISLKYFYVFRDLRSMEHLGNKKKHKTRLVKLNRFINNKKKYGKFTFF